MRVYLANIESWTFPNRGSENLCENGFEVGGNWLEPPFHRQLEEFSPDVVVYAPHRRVDAVVLHREDVLRTPMLLWALYPDYLTGWDREKNLHMDGFLEPVADIMPYCRRHAVSSLFSRRLLEERIGGFQFDVCFLGLDLVGIDRCRQEKRTEHPGLTVLWQHRWRTDKNLRGALGIIETLAAQHRDVTFLIGRKEDWDEPFWVPPSLRDYYAEALPRLSRLGNVQYLSRFSTQVDYWRLLSEVDIAFSCSYHETFGIAMLEAAYAGAACVVPNTVAYPEIHSGALLVDHSQIGSALDRLIQEPRFRAEVAQRCRQNAKKYDVSTTAEKLAGLIAKVRDGQVGFEYPPAAASWPPSPRRRGP
jgi:glycosyltransferase involved in cell wall biosynthesis